MPGVRDINVGDQIKVLANVYSGTYNADSVVIEHNAELNDDSFTTYVDIPAPYILDSKRSGNVLLGGMKITTTNPHGISPEYAAQNKRIGIHFAYPKAYNRFYNISSVDAYNIYIDEVMTQSDESIDYYRYETTSVSRNDNIYVTTDNPFLTKTTITYASNSAIIAPNDFAVNDGTITFKESVLPQNNSYVTVNIIREINRSFDRYPVVTTVDHNKIRLNGVNFTINSYNNPEAISKNINRAASLMRGWLTPTGSGMQFSFPMLKDYRTPVFAPDGSLRPAHTINNYGPYIRDKNTLARIQHDPDIDTGVISLSSPEELNKNEQFNQGAIKIGPTKGATYYDEQEKTWMVWLQDGALDTQGGYYPLGVFYEGQNRTVLPKRKKIFKIVPSGHIDDGPILDTIPGSYPLQRNDINVPGQTQYQYDLNAVKQYSFPALWISREGVEVVPKDLISIQDSSREPGTIKLFRYRLKPSTQGYYEVYEMVEMTNGEIVGIKVDSAIPPRFPHNYYGTQTASGNFFGLASNSINFDTRVSFNASNTELYPDYSGGSLVIPAVQPPADIGKTLIPEPYAIRRSGRTLGNGSDSLLNWLGLPYTVFKINSQGQLVFRITKPGFDTFNMWQPGIIPGLKNPPNSSNETISKPFGKGRGYYEQGDGNTPEMFQVISTIDDMADQYDYGNIVMGWDDPRHCPSYNPFTTCEIPDSQPVQNDYPVINVEQGWYTPQPRFKYSKRFTIETWTSNDDVKNNENDWANSSVYYNSQESRYAVKSTDGTNPVFVNGNYPDQADTTFRPDEIFVACFWTEKHTYRNQIVGYGPDAQNAGNRTPIIKDYRGTITRCKYIRLTELPLDAVLVRPECDTGWGGEIPDLYQQSSRSAQDNSTAMDLLSTPVDETGGSSATQNKNINTGAEFTGGVSPEDPNPNEVSALDINNQQQLPGGYQAENNTLIEPGEQLEATPPNFEARPAVGIGLSDLSAVAFELGSPGGEQPPNNAGTNVNENLQQNTDIVYPTIPNTNGGASAVLNPPQIILPGPCDIVPAPQGNTTSSGGTCENVPSSVLAFTAANNYYGIVLNDWSNLSSETSVQKWEWHNFGKVANFYGGTRAYIELVCDFRDDMLTAGGVTVVQNRFPFGKLGGGQTFDPRNPSQSTYVDTWWQTATIIKGLNTIPESTPEIDMLQYGVDRFEATDTPSGRAIGNNIPSVARIGLSTEDGSGFTPTRPSNWPSQNSVDWLTDDSIIGGSYRAQSSLGTFANHNSVKGAFGFRASVDCAKGEYLTVFVHIGHGSGNNGTAIPRYDLWIRYNHNIFGYGGATPSDNNPCGDGSQPQSAIFAGGAHAKAYKSQTTSSTDAQYKAAAAIKSSETGTINWSASGSGQDQTNLLPEGSVNAWLFDNIYFPYNGPIRQGLAEDEPENPGSGGTGYNQYCCDPTLDPGTQIDVYNTPYCQQYRGEGLCGDRSGGGGGFGGGGGGPGGPTDGFNLDER